MAIYHLSMSVISRKAGRSATASAAYCSAEKIIDERTREIHDYTRKRGVVHTEICYPNMHPLGYGSERPYGMLSNSTTAGRMPW